MIDTAKVVDLVDRALPTAEPFAAIPLLKRQIEFLDGDQGLDLLTRLIEGSHPSNLVIPEKCFKKWPAVVAERVPEYVRRLPKGKSRIRALCHLHQHLNLDEKREVLDGILDGTFPTTDFEFGKPINHDEVIEEFVKTLPNAWQDELLNQEVGIEQVMVRVKLDRLDEEFLRRAWSEIDHDVSDGEVPDDYFGLAEYLPMDLRSKALEVIRSAKDHSDRLHHLQNFDEELTEAERIEIVTIPWHGVGGESGDSGTLAQHLEFIEKHIPKIPYRYCVEWLEKVLDFKEDYDLQRGLVVLLDCLKNDDRKRAICALVKSVLRVDTFYTIKEFWRCVPDEEFEGFY